MTRKTGLARQVVYLTGAPATGKTTTAMRLAQSAPVQVFSYGALLTQRIPSVTRQAELRERSAEVIRERDVVDLDDEMVAMVRGAPRHCLIDSHAVTKERFGFRVVPYDIDQARALGITAIVCLYADPSTIAARTRADSQGRPTPAEAEIAVHQTLQMSLALTYAHTCGVTAYFVRSDAPTEEVARTISDLCCLEME